jgi:RNA polymerase sigma-70 factor (ECF subfamily)
VEQKAPRLVETLQAIRFAIMGSAAGKGVLLPGELEAIAMGDNGDSDSLAVEGFRSYLCALARIQVAARPWLAAKLDASDVVQQALLKAHAAREQFRGQTAAEMAVWLRQILTRTLANELRALGQQKRDAGAERSLQADLDASSCRLDAWLVADQSTPSEQVGRRERAAALASAVEALPSEQQEVVLLKHCHGLALADIAARLGRSQAAVAGLLRRGLERLRELLQEDNMP